ncbi:MAG: ArgE/DapE family deacylase, partial [Patescibacteria group bacterium]
LLKELIRIDSNVDISNKKIIEFIKEKLKEFEIKEFTFKKGDLELSNLIIKIPGEKLDSPLVFVAHTDTVPVSGDWSLEPFNPIEKDGNIYGLGSTDMKAGISCMISAVLSLSKKPAQDIYLIFDADEEGGGLGAINLIKEFSLENARIIIAEPTTKRLVLGQKGCLDLEIEVTGKAMHSAKTNSQKNQENNAIYKTVKIINALLEYEKEIEKKEEGQYGTPTFNIGFISGGTAPNVLAGKCNIKVSRRLIPSENIDQAFKEIQEVVSKEDPSAKLIKLFCGDSFKTEEETSFIKKIKEISINKLEKCEVGIKFGWTEASHFSKWGETIIFGPGLEEKAHQPDEYVEIRDLEIFTEIYKELMKLV